MSPRKPDPASARDTATLAAETFAERRRMVELLTDLTPEQWRAPSLCERWTVRDVVAHTTMPYRYSGPQFLIGLLRSGFRFNAFSDRAARADAAALGEQALMRVLTENTEHPWRPPGGGQRGALAHEVIHAHDITEALGLPATPPERIAMALADSDRKQLAYFGVDLTGIRLVAIDSDLVVGDGERSVPMTSSQILLVSTGRKALKT